MAAKSEHGSNTGAQSAAARRDVAALTAADTLPPMPLRELLSAGGANLFVLSVDNELIDTVQRASGEHYPVFGVADWLELETAVETEHCGIVVLDADLLGSKLTRHIDQLEAYADRLVVLVAADRAGAQGLMGLLSERKIHRLLIKPPAPGITRLLVESAVKRCLQLRELKETSGDVAAGAVPLQRRRKSMPVWIFVAAGAALLAGVGLVVGVSSWWREQPITSTAITPQSKAVVYAGPPPPGELRLAELLARADQAFRAGRLTAPGGDNALDYYLTILAANPADETARDRLAVVIDTLFAQAESALLAGSLEDAADALAHVRSAEPTSSRLLFLETQLERTRAATAPSGHAPVIASVVVAALPVVPSELDSLLTIARARLQRGDLLEPASDNAAVFLERAAQLAPDNAAVAALRTELVAALVATARSAVNDADFEAADPFVAEARRLGADGETLALIDAELEGARATQLARRHAAWLAAAQQRLRGRALIAPEADSAGHYLALLQADAPNFFGLGSAWRDWIDAVTSDARAALAARRWEVAAPLLAALPQAPGGEAAAAPLLAELEFGRRQEQYLAVAAPASEFKLLEQLRLVYPEAAQLRGQEGWVDLEFTIDATGTTRDVVVTQAEPARVFEESALTVVNHYRFAPFEQDGRRYQRRARVRVRFTLE